MNQASPQDSALVIFTGLVAELNPADLPQGAAAISCDMDYTVGSAKTRNGVQSVYTFTNLNVTKNTGLGTNAVGPGVAWVNPNNIVNDTPGTYAVATFTGPISFIEAVAGQYLRILDSCRFHHSGNRSAGGRQAIDQPDPC